MGDPSTEPADEAPPALPDYVLDPNAVLGDTKSHWRYGVPPDYSNTRKTYQESMPIR